MHRRDGQQKHRQLHRDGAWLAGFRTRGPLALHGLLALAIALGSVVQSGWKVMRAVALVVATLSEGLAPAAETNAASADNSPKPADFLKRTYCYKQVGDCKIQADVYRFAESTKRP